MDVRVNDGSSISVSTADLPPKYSGIFATAMTPTGFPARELTPETRINIPMPSGKIMEGVPLRVAENAGLIERDENGKYREKVAGEPEATNDAPNAPVPLPDEKAEQY